MSEEKIQQLSIIEQSIVGITNQKQAFQKQLLETESALNALQGTTNAYKIVGSVMIQKTSDEIKKELEEKNGILKTRVEQLEKQEQTLHTQAKKIREEVMNNK